MDYRPLGRPGVQVSKLCLGTMMFGAWGNPDHDDSIRLIQRALDAGINFVDTADVYSAGESEQIVGKALEGRRDDVVLATKFFMPMGEDRNRRGGSRRWIIAEVENSLRRLGTDWIDLYQVHRPDPDTDIDETLGELTDLVQQGKSATSGRRRSRPARSWKRSGRRATGAWSASAPSSRPTRCSSAASSSTCCPRPSAKAWASSPTARWPAAGSPAAGPPTDSPTSPARQRLVARFDMSLPENQRKLEAVEQLAAVAENAGVSMIELAIAFVVNHPAVTSAIIGPRTMEQLKGQLPAADVLDAAVLDRIDEVVKPGVNLNPADTSYGERVLEPALRRR